MTLSFDKYQATGNDFVMIDNRKGVFPKDNHLLIARLCDRKFGLGADGLILIEEAKEANYSMLYFNADGAPGSFCGNGSRAATRFAESLGMIIGQGSLQAFDGQHTAEIDRNLIKVSMANVQNGSKVLNGTFIDTGSPHYVEIRDDLEVMDVFTEGKKLREDDQFKPGGSNINFIKIKNKFHIKVRTFERGVENETLSCGTGVAAAAMIATKEKGPHTIKVETLGGVLEIKFDRTAAGFENVFLTGPAERVFSGKIEI